MKPVANLAAAEANKDNRSKCDITVADILGPLCMLKEAGTSAETADGSDRARDTNFSLLSYSFSLVGPGNNLKQSTVLIGICWAAMRSVQYRGRVRGGLRTALHGRGGQGPVTCPDILGCRLV